MVDKRTRAGLYWEMDGPYGSEVKGFKPDKLATKTLDEADNSKEMVFISIRDIMQADSAKCMDDEDDRLDLCEKITNWVYQNRRKIT